MDSKHRRDGRDRDLRQYLRAERPAAGRLCRAAVQRFPLRSDRLQCCPAGIRHRATVRPSVRPRLPGLRTSGRRQNNNENALQAHNIIISLS